MELLESTVADTWLEPAATVGDLDDERPLGDTCVDVYGAAFWRVLRGVFEEVHEQLLDENGIAGHEQVARNLDAHLARTKEPLDAVERAADQLFDRLQLLFQRDAPGFESRHRQHVLDELFEVLGLFEERRRQV